MKVFSVNKGDKRVLVDMSVKELELITQRKLSDSNNYHGIFEFYVKDGQEFEIQPGIADILGMSSVVREKLADSLKLISAFSDDLAKKVKALNEVNNA